MPSKLSYKPDPVIAYKEIPMKATKTPPQGGSVALPTPPAPPAPPAAEPSLGSTVRDKLTGFVGVVVCRTEWLHSCVSLGVQGDVLHDGKPTDPVYIDLPRLEVIDPEP